MCWVFLLLLAIATMFCDGVGSGGICMIWFLCVVSRSPPRALGIEIR